MGCRTTSHGNSLNILVESISGAQNLHLPIFITAEYIGSLDRAKLEDCHKN
jgi:hypothetical protein